MNKQEIKSMKIKVPACSCIVEVDEHGVRPIHLCEYHFSVSKNGLGKIFVGS